MKRSLEDSPPSKRQRAEETKESTKADLHVLSDHVILKYIFSFFTSPRELVNLSLVHREWNATVENDKELLLVRTNKWYKMNGLWRGYLATPQVPSQPLAWVVYLQLSFERPGTFLTLLATYFLRLCVRLWLPSCWKFATRSRRQQLCKGITSKNETEWQNLQPDDRVPWKFQRVLLTFL